MDSVTTQVNRFYERYPYPSLVHFGGNYDSQKHADRILNHMGLKAKDFSPDQRVLDVGCGTGEITCSLASHGAQVTGIDLCRASLQRAQTLAKRQEISSVSFVRGNLHHLPLKGQFDHVFSLGVLHHCPDSRQAFNHLTGLVKPNGLLTLGLYSVFGKLKDRLDRQLFFFLGGNDLEKRIDVAARFLQSRPPSELERTYLADKHVHPHETYVSAKEVLQWFKETGFEFVASSPALNPRKPLFAELAWLWQRKAFFLATGRKGSGNAFKSQES